MKKLLLGLGALGTAITPVIVVVACGTDTPAEVNYNYDAKKLIMAIPEAKVEKTPTKTYVEAVEYKDFATTLLNVASIVSEDKPADKTGKTSLTDTEYAAYIYHYVFEGQKYESKDLPKDVSDALLSITDPKDQKESNVLTATNTMLKDSVGRKMVLSAFIVLFNKNRERKINPIILHVERLDKVVKYIGHGTSGTTLAKTFTPDYQTSDKSNLDPGWKTQASAADDLDAFAKSL